MFGKSSARRTIFRCFQKIVFGILACFIVSAYTSSLIPQIITFALLIGFCLYQFHCLRKEIDTQLSNVHTRFESIFEDLSIPTWVVDTETYDIRYMNKKGREYFGSDAIKKCYEMHQLNGHPLKQPCDCCMMETVKEAGKKGESVESERYCDIHGLWFKKYEKMIFSSEGDSLKLTMQVDVSRLKEFADSAKFTPDIILTITLDNRIVFENENEQCYKIFGRKSKELIGMDLISLYAKKDQSLLQETIRTVIETRKPATIELTALHENGHEASTNQIIFCTIDEKNNKVQNLILVVQDIAEMADMRHELVMRFNQQEFNSAIAVTMLKNIPYATKFNEVIESLLVYFQAKSYGIFYYCKNTNDWCVDTDLTHLNQEMSEDLISVLIDYDVYEYLLVHDYMTLIIKKGLYIDSDIIIFKLKKDKKEHTCFVMECGKQVRKQFLLSNNFLASLQANITMGVENELMRRTLTAETFRMKSLFNATQSWIVYTDENYVITDENNKILFVDEQIVGENLLELIAGRIAHTPNTLERIHSYLRKTMESGISCYFNAHIEGLPNVNRSEFYLAAYVIPFIDRNNKVNGLTLIVTDGTNERNKEIELSVMRTGLTALLSKMPISLWMLDRQGKIISVEGSLCEKELFEKTLSNEKSSLAINIKNSLQGEPINFIYHNTETNSYINHYISPFYSDTEQLSGVVGVSVDVSNIEVMQQKVIRLNHRLEMAINVAKLGVWDIDVETTTVHCDKNTFSLLDMHPTDGTMKYETFTRYLLEGRTLEELQERIMESHEKNLSDDESYAFYDTYLENKMTLDNGHVRYSSSFIRAILRTDGTLEKIFGISLDNTNHMELTMQLTSAKEKTEQASRAKSEFISKMSHEIKTPMGAIISMAQIAQQAKSKEHLNSCLSKIGMASNHLLSIINDILDISKIESGKFELFIEQFSLSDTLRDTFSLISHQMTERKQEFHVYIDEKLPEQYYGDTVKLSQVIINLLSNAVKFTPEGGFISVRVCLDAIEGNQAQLRYEVKDSGIGIPPSRIETIFDSFEQADGSITRRFGGTGLGLSIARNIVRMMKGELWAESEEGKGSTFIFTIILDIYNEEFSTNNPPLPYSNLKLKNNCILIVGNEQSLSKSAEALLEESEMTVHYANNEASMIEHFKHSPDRYDMVLVDTEILSGSNLLLSEKIYEANVESAKIIPIVAITNADTESFYGMDATLTKPATEMQLYRLIQRYIFNSNIEEEVTTPEEIGIPSMLNYKGIDIEKGLSHLKGNESLYRRLLKNFKDNSTMENLKRHIENGNKEEALLTISKTKSLATNLGLYGIASSAGEVETFLKMDILNFKSSLQQMEEQYEIAIHSVNEFLKGR